MNRAQENKCFARFQESRDPRLLARVFDATATELLEVAMHLSKGDVELGQEALQATFLTAIEKAGQYDPSRDVRPWLLGILANHVRKERRATLKHRGPDASEVGLVAKDSPVGGAQAAELGDATFAAMQKLSSPLREPLVLHLHHGLTATEIGTALGRQPATVRVQIQRGMQRLRELLPVGFAAAALGATLATGPVLAAVRREVLATLPAVGASSLLVSGWRIYTMIAASLAALVSVLLSLLATPDTVLPPVNRAALTSTAPSSEQIPAVAARELIAESSANEVSTEPPQQPIPGNHVPVELQVIYESDGAQAADVPIAIEIDGEQRVWRTDANGVARMAVPWPGVRTAVVLGTQTEQLLMWPAFASRPNSAKHQLVIPSGMTVDVTVVDGSGEPVADAVVEGQLGSRVVRQWCGLGRTDAKGRFQRRDMATAGNLRAWCAGYAPANFIYVNANPGDVKQAKFVLSRPGLLARGIVRDESGRPLPDAQLAVVQLQYGQVPPQFLRTDERGQFEITTLQTGTHILVGQHRGKQLRRGMVRFVHTGEGVPEVAIRLTKGATVMGRLLGEGSLGGCGVWATCVPECASGLPFLDLNTETAVDGSFTLTGLIAGRYELRASNAKSVLVDIREGETREWHPRRIEQLPTGVRLLDHLGQPLVGWRVSLIPEGALTATRSKLTVANGELMYAQDAPWLLPEGTTCRFAVFRGNGTLNRNWLAAMVTPPLPVGLEHEIRVPAFAASKHEITATVVDHEGKPIPGAKIILEGEHCIVGMAVSDDEGGFRLVDQPPGRFQPYVRVAGQASWRLPAIDVGSGKTHDIGRIVVPQLAQLTARPSTGASFKGGALVLSNEHGETFRLRKYRDGSWRSAKIYSGDYELRGWTDGGRVVPQKVALSPEHHSIEFVTTPSATSNVVVLFPHDFRRDAASWSGTITATQNGKLVFEDRLRHSFRGVYTDRLAFDVGLPPGKLQVRVTTSGKRIGEASAKIAANGGGKVTIQVQ